MKWLKQLIREAMMDPAPPGEEQYPERQLYDKQTSARNTPAEEMLATMASSIAVVFRIDNGFMVAVNMTDEAHMGRRGKLLYAKDANEVGALMIGQEAAFKIGSRANGSVGLAQAPGFGTIAKISI